MTASVAHLDDGALLRWLDGEPEPAAAAHAPELCALCAERAGVLGRRAAALRTLLLATDAPAPPAPDVQAVLRLAAARAAAAGTADPATHGVPARPTRALRPPPTAVRPAWRARPAVRLAAAGVALAAASLAAQPVRRWAAAQWARLTGAPVAAAPRAGQAPPPAPNDTARAELPARPSVVVRFTPSVAARASGFTVRFDARPAGGVLRLAVGAGPGASAAVAAVPGAAETEDLLVLPAGVRVRNQPGAAREYWVTAPAGTARVRVVFARPAGDTVVTLDAARPVVLPLGTAGAARGAAGP